MHRRQFLQSASLATGTLLLPHQAWMQNLFFPTGFFTLLRNDIYTYTERGGTIACLLTPEHAVVVDTQFQEQATSLRNLLEATHAQPLDLLINTHHHGDHTSGNPVFRDWMKTHIAHINAKANQERVAQENNKLAEVLLPTTTFEDEWSQSVGSEKVRLHYFGPAHTNGDAMVHFENAHIVHTGDLVFNRRFPYVDKSAGAHIGNWIDVLGKARRHFGKDALYVFGHAGDDYPITGTDEDLKMMAHFLKMSLRYVKKAKKTGQSLENLLATTTYIPGAPAFKGKGVERVLKAAWEELEE
ncbi:MAG: MBL fold metallo-hydrolase [Saprospiraceae bacterium]